MDSEKNEPHERNEDNVLCFPKSTFRPRKPDRPTLTEEEIRVVAAAACCNEVPWFFPTYVLYGWILRRIFIRLSKKIAADVTVAAQNKAARWAAPDEPAPEPEPDRDLTLLKQILEEEQ